MREKIINSNYYIFSKLTSLCPSFFHICFLPSSFRFHSDIRVGGQACVYCRPQMTNFVYFWPTGQRSNTFGSSQLTKTREGEKKGQHQNESKAKNRIIPFVSSHKSRFFLPSPHGTVFSKTGLFLKFKILLLLELHRDCFST